VIQKTTTLCVGRNCTVGRFSGVYDCYALFMAQMSCSLEHPINWKTLLISDKVPRRKEDREEPVSDVETDD